jgi:hypothetical protein
MLPSRKDLRQNQLRTTTEQLFMSHAPFKEHYPINHHEKNRCCDCLPESQTTENDLWLRQPPSEKSAEGIQKNRTASHFSIAI